MKNETGFIFLSVLVFLPLFSLLGVYENINLSDEFKKIHQQQQREDSLLLAKNILKQKIVTLSQEKSHCYITQTSAERLAKKPFFWWEHHACAGNLSKNHYYYVLESLGVDPCAMISDATLHLVAHYVRMNLYLLVDHPNTHLILQSTIALPEQTDAICKDKLHRINPGRQMWREI